VLKANIDLFLEYGRWSSRTARCSSWSRSWLSYLSIVFYVLFKVCERILIERLTGKPLGEVRDAQR
jgi:hypothetical protein